MAEEGAGHAPPQALEGGSDPAALLAAWRARGDDRFDPVRFRFLEAMARRSGAHRGATRRRLDERLAGLVADYGAALARGAGTRSAAAAPPAGPGPLGGLVRHAERQPPGTGAGPEAIDYFHRTWSRLSAERRLTQSLAKVPENAGPLNSHHLVHRALTLMRDTSPAYLQHFMSYADSLLWLDQASGAGVAPPESQRAESPRKGGRRR